MFVEKGREIIDLKCRFREPERDVSHLFLRLNASISGSKGRNSGLTFLLLAATWTIGLSDSDVRFCRLDPTRSQVLVDSDLDLVTAPDKVCVLSKVQCVASMILP